MSLSHSQDSSNSAFLTAETDFGLNMMRQAPATEPLVVSPISVIFALGMIQLGAKGKTKTQINQLISKESSDIDIINYYSNLSSQIQNATNGVSTRIANGFFLNKQFAISDQYRGDIAKKYAALIQSVDFTNQQQAAETINTFVNETTAGKIEEIVKAEELKDPFSIIVNAIYFNAEWEIKFDSDRNSLGTFHSTPEKGREITFMNDFGVYRLYTEDQDVQVLSLSYKDTSYAFNIFLPKQKYNLATIRENFKGETIQKYLSQLDTTKVSITIPKIKIETNFKLKEALVAMGATEMFTKNADLSGIVKAPPLYVSKAAHKAIIEVDEAGTTAAAATMMEIMAGSGMGEPKSFVADHPFMFVLTKDRNPLFIGQFV
ncbi:hypothetical protein RB195_015704 [Necator americanus]|uniref:Serpin domain-containing protein n=1 Tax=Necator americanus TaxID=51031 RepID=A0ABR1E5U2_NECAM